MNGTVSALPAAAWILGESPVSLWGLAGSERLERQLRVQNVARVLRIGRDGEAPVADGSVLVMRADHLFDDRLVASLVANPSVVLEISMHGGATRPVAAHVPAGHAAVAREVLEGKRDAAALAGVTVRNAATIGASYVRKVLKANQPKVLEIRADRQKLLERYLFDESYKGVTDLVTKFVWPTPARQVVRLCANLGIPPNAVTAMSLVLVIYAGWCFLEGRFLEGLAAGWLMTFLDTVDGKLARVTVTSSPVGHYFDHGIDVVHPPLWYLAWACGLVGGISNLASLELTLYALFGGYIAGRLAESTFNHYVGKFSLFTWQPFDSFFRLITGRRNPNMLLLTFFSLIGRPDLGLTSVAAWTMVSSLVLLFRVAQGHLAKSRGETLRPWLESVGPDSISHVPRYARPFVADPAARLAVQMPLREG